MAFGDYGTYVGGLDLGLAVGAAIVGAAIAMVAYVFVQSILDDMLAVIPQLGARLGRINRTRHRSHASQWVCRECRSINAPTAVWCYRGCGSRYRLEDARVDFGMSFHDTSDDEAP
jgi:hypothetical protein